MLDASNHVNDSMRFGFRIANLLRNQIGKVNRMKGVPHLQTFSAKTDVAKRSFSLARHVRKKRKCPVQQFQIVRLPPEHHNG
jgi:hypothetical protein